MQPYEIRQRHDGTIDYNNYYARPISLLTPNMRRFCSTAVSAKFWLLLIATITVLAVIPLVAFDGQGSSAAAEQAKKIAALQHQADNHANNVIRH